MGSFSRLIVRLAIPLGIVLLLVMVIFFGGASSPQEQLVQSILEMRDGFNSQSAGDVLRHCSEDFKESEYDLDSSSFRAVLVRIFLTELDRKDRSFLWRASIFEDQVSVQFEGPEEEATSATVVAPVAFHRRGRLAGKSVWVLEIAGRAAREEGGGWKFTSARFKTLSGRRPF
ncbi:MAG: hypothetical protein OSB09_02665 [Planctomycetota bacterium]|nr:hypothetical protein [Planctomycetota bacterium]